MKVLVIEDSPLYQKVMVKVLGTFKIINSVDTASTGNEGLARIRNKEYDVLFLDLQLPDMNGLQILEAAKVIAPAMHVIIVSASGGAGSDLTVKCLQKGALEFIVKPSAGTLQQSAKALQQMLAMVLKTLRYKSTQRTLIQRQSVIPLQKREPIRSRFAPDPGLDYWLTTIAISTGGPQSLARVIPALPREYPHPILIVQHMPAGFTASLANSLNTKSSLNVLEAAEGMVAEQGHVYIAPGGVHMVAKRVGGVLRLHLNEDPPECRIRPSANVLFKSLAAIAERRSILSLVLTGMGEDGMEGVRILKKGKCYCISQSEDSCIVYGMPRAIEKAGLSDEVVGLNEIATRMEMLTMRAPIKTV